MKRGDTGDDDADGVNEAAMGKDTGTPPDTSSSPRPAAEAGGVGGDARCPR